MTPTYIPLGTVNKCKSVCFQASVFMHATCFWKSEPTIL